MVDFRAAGIRLRSLLNPRQSLESRFFTGVFWTVVGVLFSQVLGMVAGVITARLLGKVGYGEFGIINSTLGTFGTFAGLGLGMTATRHVAQHRAVDPALAGRILGLIIQVAFLSGALVAAVLYLLAPLLAEQTLKAPYLSGELRIGCLLLFVNAMNGTQIGALAGLEAFKATAVVNGVRAALNLPMMVGGAFWFGVPGVVVATVIVGVASWILNGVAMNLECQKSGIQIRYRESWAEMGVLWTFSLPAFLCNIAQATTLWVADAILVNQASGYGKLGLFNAADQWRTVLIFLPSAFLQVALPLMSRSLGTGDTSNGYGRSLLMTQGFSILAVLPVGTALMFLSDQVMKLYGSAFSAGGIVLVGVVAGVMIQSVVAATGPAIQAAGKMWVGFGINALWGTTLISVVWAAAPVWGATGVAFAFVLSYLLLAIVSFAYLKPMLPANMAIRAFLSIGYVLVLTFTCVVLQPQARMFSAAPALLISACLTYYVFLDRGLRQAMVAQVRTFVTATR